MIAAPCGWEWSHAPGGALLQPRTGDRLAIHYAEHMRPTRSVLEIVEDAVAEVTGLEVHERPAPRVVITGEGEYGAHATVRGRRGGAPAQLDVGVVFVGDSYSRFLGATADPSSFGTLSSTVGDLVQRDAHMVERRRRRFWYLPPAGWQALDRPGQTDWYPLDYPGTPTVLTVWRAMPRERGGSCAGFVHALVGADIAAGWKLLDSGGEHPVLSGHGLEGARLHLRGKFPGRAETHRHVVVFEDVSWFYPIVFETVGAQPAAAAERTLAAVIRSVRPLPRAEATADAAAALGHWCV